MAADAVESDHDLSELMVTDVESDHDLAELMVADVESDHDLAELMVADAVESDLDLAYHLQLQEVMAASLASSSTAPAAAASSSEEDSQTRLQAMELDLMDQEERDRALSKDEMRRVAIDLKRQVHDAAFAREILRIPDDEWADSGDRFERPIDAGASPAEYFKLYFKGLVAAEASLAAVGVAVCDPGGKPLLQIGRPVLSTDGGVGLNRTAVELKALIEGLHALISLDIKRVDIIFDVKPVYHYVTKKWMPKQRKIVNLISEVFLIQRELEASRMFLKPSCELQFVYKIARDTINSQLSKPVEGNAKKSLTVTCSICLEDTDLSQMFVVDECSHRFCFSCMRQHVEVQLLHGVLPNCPHDGCGVKLNVDSSRKYLNAQSIEILTQRVQEASIPETDRLYCPYPKCSALMSKREMILKHQGESSFQCHPHKNYGTCTKCCCPLCLNCKEKWHGTLSCVENKRYNPHREEAKLENLAKQRFWRRCVKCNHMIELAEGCFHMTCRCGYEFCYTCGAEWKNKKATCACPLWTEDNIIYNDGEESDDYYDDESDEDDYYFLGETVYL